MRTESPAWRKSSFSSNGSDCVEIRSDLGAIRDSKIHGGPDLVSTTHHLIAAIKADRLMK